MSQTPLCQVYKLAFVQLPNDKDFAAETIAALKEICFSPSAELQLNVEHKAGNIDAVTLWSPGKDGEQIDVGKDLVTDGLALVEPRRESRFKKLVSGARP